MSCRSIESESLMSWVDGGLDADAARTVACHIATCPHCQEQVALLRAETDALRKALGGKRAPAQLFARIAIQLAAEERPSKTDLASAGMRGRFSSALIGAASVAAILMVAVIFNLTSGSLHAPSLSLDVVAFETTRDYKTFRASQRELDVASDDPSETIAWLSARIDKPLPALSEKVLEYQLVGGRLCLLLGQRLGALTYESQAGQITVYLVYSPIKQAKGSLPEVNLLAAKHKQDGIGSIVWSQDGLVIAVLSTLPDAEKSRFAEAFRKSLNTQFLEI